MQRGGRAQHWLRRRVGRYLARALLAEGTLTWQEDRHRIDEAIDKVERAWSLTGDPDIAVQLCTMYDQANLNERALVVLRETFRRHPRHPLLRHHAAITLLRHGAAADVRDFFDSLLKVDADDAFGRFIASLLDSYDAWVDEVVSTIRQAPSGKPPYIIACPVWGQPFTEHFIRYVCAALLSENNLPALARHHSVTFVVFTSAETAARLTDDPLFNRIGAYSTVRIVRYSDSQLNYRDAMEAGYGSQPVFYSDRSLAFYYARNCKFALMSCAHYVALAAGRETDALVSCLIADTILSDGALMRMAEILGKEADAVLLNSMQLPAPTIRPAMDSTLRRADGVLHLSSADCTKLLIEHLPEYNFALGGKLPWIPLRICWRVGDAGILVHGNHYHPFGLRPKAFTHPLRLSIDPIDSRFLDRTSLQEDRVHIVQDASIVALSMEEGESPEQLAPREQAWSPADLAFWLWGYWGRFRGRLFRSPLRIGQVTSSAEWQRTEAEAAAIVNSIVARAAELEARHSTRASWRL